jgi:hypothetical protein
VKTMDRHEKHPTDETILLLLDGAMSQRAAKDLQEHLAACAICDDRRRRLEELLQRVEMVYAAESGKGIPSSPAARNQLQARMQEHHSGRSGEWLWAISAAAVLIAILGAAGYRNWKMSAPSTATLARDRAESMPDHAMTPGSVRPVTVEQICSAADDDQDPTVPPAVRQTILREYGITGPGPNESYQIDYLINPQLGGTDDVKNLWPEPYETTQWNARAKDQLEHRMHEMVCKRTLDLTAAQREIATNWISAYKKYIQDEPSANLQGSLL